MKKRTLKTRTMKKRALKKACNGTSFLYFIKIDY